MKEKLIGLMGVLKDKNVIKAIVAIVAVIVILVVLFNTVFSAKPKKYEEKIKNFTKALSSESKMKDLIKDKVIDLKGAAAWAEAEQDAEDFKKEYKNLKKDDDEVSDMEDGLKKFAEKCEDSDVSYKVKSIKKPEKSDKNGKIYMVSATLVNEKTDSEDKVKFVFYNGKLIDLYFKDSKMSLFEISTKLETLEDSLLY